ncbi:MAG: S8 family serine peptidase, partial [Ktedonobacteraceae bacterium]|nr:S8 family serine peptidase [Ktedonobacteraceae bacterium]
ALNLPGLNGFLNMMGYNLKPFQEQDVRYVAAQNASQSTDSEADLKSLTGKYVFQHPSGQGSLVKCFFHVEKQAAYSMMGAPVVQGMGMMGSMYDSGMSGFNNATVGIVNMLNSNREVLRRETGISMLAASPNWLSGGTPVNGGCETHGCPQSPPIPVREPYSSWHINLPNLSPALQERTGEGVTVFVLDTRPEPQRIAEAAQRAGTNNTLLQTIAEQISSEEPSIVLRDPELALPWIIEESNAQQPATGRDICGRLVGFDVTDHGTFVMGIVRDVAPGAKIECVRVLNNYGVGTVGVLVEALEEIHHRMSEINPETGEAGDLYGKPVVINLSLVTIPHQEEVVQWWSMGAYANQVRMTEETEPLPHSLHGIIQSLAALGAVIVGAAGNDSDVRQCFPMSKPKTLVVSTERMKPRFPAAFPEVISVGAVDKDGHATAYSNDPVGVGSTHHNGVATYGGGIPVPIFPEGGECEHTHADCDPFDEQCMTGVDLSRMDALVGVYTARCYPALSVEDEQQSYSAPNDNGWAYWSGTSFAAPIISGVAARLLDELTHNPQTSSWEPHHWHDEVMRAFTRAQGQRRWLTGGEPLPLQPEFSRDAGVNIGMMRAEQVPSNEGSAAAQQAEEVVV